MSKEELDLSNFTVDAQKKLDEADFATIDQENERIKSKTHQTILKKIEKERDEFEKNRASFQKKNSAETEEKVRKDLLFKITQYFERFPFLLERVPKIRATASLPELAETINLIKYEMNSQNSLQNIQNYITYGFMALESVWGDGSQMTMLPQEARLNLKGLSKYLQTGIFNEDLVPLIMEIDIEYPRLGRRSLPLRIVEKFLTVVTKVHLLNSNPAAQKMMNLEETDPIDIEPRPKKSKSRSKEKDGSSN